MDRKLFKNLFNDIAKANSFINAFGGWYKSSNECIVVLELQKSSYSNCYYLNLKVFVQGAFNRIYVPDKNLIKSPMGHITNQIREEDVLDFTNSMCDELRKRKLECLFSELIVPFSEKTLSKSGLNELANQGEITLLPAVKYEIANSVV